MKKLPILLLYLIFSSTIISGQEYVLKQTNASGIYKRGEKIRMMAFVGSHKGDSISFRVLKNNNQVLLKKSFTITTDSITLFDGSFGEPCSIIADVKSKSSSPSLGAIVDPENL